MIKVFVDAATKDDHVGIGCVIYKDKMQIQYSIYSKENINNHEAEFKAMIYVLKELIKQKYHQDVIFIYSDSQVVVTAMNRLSAKNDWQHVYVEEIKALVVQFEQLFCQWSSDKQNKLADVLAKRAIRQQVNTIHKQIN